MPGRPAPPVPASRALGRSRTPVRHRPPIVSKGEHEAFDDRYELREFAPGTDDKGHRTQTPSPDCRPSGSGSTRRTPATRRRHAWSATSYETANTWLGAYVRRPATGSVDETWPAGTFAWFRKALSWGDGSSIDTQAISAVTVRPTERRRGILRRMMTHALERGVAEGYAIASLTASEGTILPPLRLRERHPRARPSVSRRNRALPFLAPTTAS